MSTKAGVWSSCCFVCKFTPALITFLIAIQWQCFYFLMQIVVRQGFCFNTQYLFVYFFKVMSDVKTSRWKRPPVFIYLCKSLVVRQGLGLIFSIYLFIYSKSCQQNQVEATTFITACNKVGVRLCFYIEN